MKRKSILVLLLSLTITSLAGLAFLMTRNKKGDLMAGAPWGYTGPKEEYYSMLGSQNFSKHWILVGSVDPRQVRDFFKTRLLASEGWTVLSGKKGEYWRFELRKRGYGLATERLTINRVNGVTDVYWDSGFSKLDFVAALIKSGGRARVTKLTPGGSRYEALWP